MNFKGSVYLRNFILCHTSKSNKYWRHSFQAQNRSFIVSKWLYLKPKFEMTNRWMDILLLFLLKNSKFFELARLHASQQVHSNKLVLRFGVGYERIFIAFENWANFMVVILNYLDVRTVCMWVELIESEQFWHRFSYNQKCSIFGQFDVKLYVDYQQMKLKWIDILSHFLVYSQKSAKKKK